MTCPKCGGAIKVIDSECIISAGKPVVLRSRSCVPCRLTIRTQEQIVMIAARAMRRKV